MGDRQHPRRRQGALGDSILALTLALALTPTPNLALALTLALSRAAPVEDIFRRARAQRRASTRGRGRAHSYAIGKLEVRLQPLEVPAVAVCVVVVLALHAWANGLQPGEEHLCSHQAALGPALASTLDLGLDLRLDLGLGLGLRRLPAAESQRTRDQQRRSARLAGAWRAADEGEAPTKRKRDGVHLVGSEQRVVSSKEQVANHK